MSTKNNPGTYRCIEKAEPDEPYFVLLGRDPTAPLIVLAWVLLRAKCGHNDYDQLAEARECAASMQAWAMALGKKNLLARARHKVAAILISQAADLIQDALEHAIEEVLDAT